MYNTKFNNYKLKGKIYEKQIAEVLIWTAERGNQILSALNDIWSLLLSIFNSRRVFTLVVCEIYVHVIILRISAAAVGCRSREGRRNGTGGCHLRCRRRCCRTVRSRARREGSSHSAGKESWHSLSDTCFTTSLRLMYTN